MAKVLVVLRILPKSVNVDLSELEEKVVNSIFPEKIEREPIAFGLIALKASKLVEDKEGEIQKIEEKLNAINLISQVEVVEITRTL
jgi:elongation factor 1-beta